MDSQSVKLEITEDYGLDKDGNAKIETAYRFLNEKDEPIFNFSKKLVKEFDATNIDIVQGPMVAVTIGSLSVRNVEKRNERGRKIVEWSIERDALVKGDPCVSLIRAKWNKLASKVISKIGIFFIAKISQLPFEQAGYTLTVTLPKNQDLEERWWKRLICDFDFASDPSPDQVIGLRTLKWRKSALNERFDVTISYGLKVKVWLMPFLATILTALLIQFLLRAILHW